MGWRSDEAEDAFAEKRPLLN